MKSDRHLKVSIVAYPTRQWAAVRMTVGEMMLPPQVWKRLLAVRRRDALHGASVMGMAVPPTILPSRDGTGKVEAGKLHKFSLDQV